MTEDSTLRNPKRQRLVPRTGTPVRGSTTGRPVMAALDLLGRRWALRVLWELRDGPVGARELRERCDRVSPSVLYDRLRELTETGIVTRDGQRYQLTELGHELRASLQPLSSWSEKWAQAVDLAESGGTGARSQRQR